ncbi:MAG: flagellar assembly protein FliW [Angelakisella sp.]
MKIETRYFGSVEIDPQEIVHFVQPIYGFEKLTDYVLLSDSTVGDCFLWLQSVTEKEVCFILLDPAVLSYDYAPAFSSDMLKLLGNLRAEDAVVRLVTVIHEDFTASTVNLKCPIVINTTEHCAAQIMLEEDYPIRAPMVQSGKEESPC